jgi:hypothetical protein
VESGLRFHGFRSIEKRQGKIQSEAIHKEGDRGVQIEKLFDDVRRTYYPDWDGEGEWSVKVTSSRDPKLRFSQGRCDDEVKTIWVNEFQVAGTDSEKVELLLIHEIAHAVSRNDHRSEWRTQMERVAEKAYGLGRKKLAGEIRKQIKEYGGILFAPS